ncbi:MAG TPA: hypothetical protein VML95_11135 [Longimicrobiales bacterium]|nr:hypothetical protein [Longimicrobiales bacterium]
MNHVDDDGPTPDLIDTLRATKQATGEMADATLAGYRREHERPPAFEGADGHAYTVEVDVEATGDPARPFASFFVFPRWAATGAGIMGHVESGDVGAGATAEDARSAAEEWTLFEIREELDAAILRREREAAGTAETEC